MANKVFINILSDGAGKAILSVPTLATDQAIVFPSTAGTLTTNEALVDTTNAANGDALIGVKQAITGSVATTQDLKNYNHIDAEDLGVSVSNSAAANTSALNAAFINCQAVGKTLVLNGLYPVNNLVIDALHGISIFSNGGGFLGAATGTYDAVLSIKNTVGVTITGDLGITASFNADYTAGVWIYSTGASTSQMDLNNIKISGARRGWKFGHGSYVDALLSEISISGGYTWGCPIAAEAWGTQTVISFNSSRLQSDYGSNPEGWDELPSGVIMAYAACVEVTVGECLIAGINSGVCFAIRPITSATYANPWGSILVTGAAVESASQLVLASNPNAVSTPGVGAVQGGFMSIIGCTGYHALNSFSFVQTSADFIGRLSIQHNNFYCGTSRSQPTIQPGSVNTVVDVDNKSFGLNFLSAYSSAGISGGRRIIDSAEEIPWTPTFASLAVVPGDGGATYTGTCTRIGRRYDWTARITTTGTCTTASTGGNTAIDNAPFPILVHSPFNVVDSTLANLGVGCAWAASSQLAMPTWAANVNDIFMSGTCII